MGVKLSDLPADVRRKVEAELGGPKRRPKPSRADKLTQPQQTLCHPCGRIFPTYLKAEQHLDAEHDGVGRIGIILSGD